MCRFMYEVNKVELLLLIFCVLTKNNKIKLNSQKIENINVMSNVKKQKRNSFYKHVARKKKYYVCFLNYYNAKYIKIFV
jgi:hypothetical protein